MKLVSNNDVRVNYTGHIRYYLPFSTESEFKRGGLNRFLVNLKHFRLMQFCWCKILSFRHVRKFNCLLFFKWIQTRLLYCNGFSQQCTLMFGSWAHSNDSIKYSLYSKNLSLIDFYDNQEWQLDLNRSGIAADGFLYDYLDPPLFWEMIVIDLVLIRQSFYYGMFLFTYIIFYDESFRRLNDYKINSLLTYWIYNQ